MLILDPGTQPLSNAEVLAHIQSLDAKYARDGRTETIPDNLRKVMRDVKSILTIPTQPTCPVDTAPLVTEAQKAAAPTFRSERVFAALARRLRAKPFSLLPAEILQVFNHVPRSRTELTMIVQEGEERFAEEVLDQCLDVIREIMVEGRGLDVVNGNGV
ncbi:hypothetical protein EJ06DRAFT_582767 [Trichodelitschia bisporula]|uniref:DNA-directed RNA polymerase III subunit RPC9 n=1 Tax=Trichodelitschia bisporula TaxID=703511 RepID=A0A6G1HTW0_9PEZI|nr:hypothetical protein EJ06DRAFT_582767 [Trichodelitschia bisporula]